MKKIYAVLFSLLCLSSATFAQIPNNSFENWTTVGTHVNPDNWGCLNDATASASTTVFTCVKGTPGNPGTGYLKLVSKNITGLGIVPGVAVCGTLNSTTHKPVSGFPYNLRSQYLVGKWQHMSASNQGYIDVLLSVWNSTLNKRDTVAYAHRVLGAMVMQWANFSINLTYVSGASPDSAIIFFSSSPATPVASDYLYIDNLSFSGTVVGINETKLVNNTVDIYPNPCRDNLNLSLNVEKSTHVTIQISDIAGRIINKEDLGLFQGNLEKTISTATLTKGLYFITIITDDNATTKHFVIE